MLPDSSHNSMSRDATVLYYTIHNHIPDKISLHILAVANHKHDNDFLFRQHMSLSMVSIHSMVPNHPHRFLYIIKERMKKKTIKIPNNEITTATTTTKKQHKKLIKKGKYYGNYRLSDVCHNSK